MNMSVVSSRLVRRALLAPTICALLAVASRAGAEGPRVHAGGGAVHAAGNDQGREFGWGGRAALGAELPVGRIVSLGVEGSLATLSKGDPPADPTLAPHRAGSLVTAAAGAVLRPFASGPFLAAEGGGAATGGMLRPVVSARIGWEVPVGDGAWAIGPTAGYTHVFQPDSALRPDDARLVWGGLQISFGSARKAPVTPPARQEAQPQPQPQAPPLVVAAVEKSGDEDTKTSSVRMEADRIAVDERIEFAFDSDELEGSAGPLLSEIAAYVRKNPQIVAIEIEGHADDVGPDDYNQRLSERRAQAVRRALAAELPGVKLSARGYGKSRPRVAGRSEGDRRVNRRVEFVVTTDAGAKDAHGLAHARVEGRQ